MMNINCFFSRTFYDFLMKKKGSSQKKKQNAKQFFQINTKKNLRNENQIQFTGNWTTV